MTDLDFYASPLSERYGDPALRALWSEGVKRQLWRRTWILLLIAQYDTGLVDFDPSDYKILCQYLDDWSPTGYGEDEYLKATAIERRTKHDLVAEGMAFGERFTPGIARRLHLGVTSSDIEDYSDLIRIRASVNRLGRLSTHLIQVLTTFVIEHASTPILGRTHLQPAEITTAGHRFLLYLEGIEDAIITLLIDTPELSTMAGAVGTYANLHMLEKEKGVAPHEAQSLMGQDAAYAKGQTYPRRFDFRLISRLAELACILSKMALDVRLMHTFGNLQERKRAPGEIGSSAMPGKFNPIRSENICSIARRFIGLLPETFDMVANQGLERTLDDSASRRFILPEALLLASHLIIEATKLVESLVIDVESCTNEIHEHIYQTQASIYKTRSQMLGNNTNNLEQLPIFLSQVEVPATYLEAAVFETLGMARQVQALGINDIETLMNATKAEAEIFPWLTAT